MWWYDGMGWVGLGEEKVTHIHLWHMVLPQSRRFVVVGAEFGAETDEDSDGKVCEDIAPAVNQRPSVSVQHPSHTLKPLFDLWWRCDTLCASGFMSYVMFAHSGHE